MILEWIDGTFCACKLAGLDGIRLGHAFTFLCVTDREISLICRTEHVPTAALCVEPDWIALRVRGELDFSLIGVLASLSRALAEAGVGILAVSTYDTDYLFIKMRDRMRAEQALLGAGFSFA